MSKSVYLRLGLGLGLVLFALHPCAFARPPQLPLFPTAGAPQATNDDAIREITADEIDRSHLPPSVLSLLDSPQHSWKHLQSPHFVLHSDKNKIFAAKVADLGERFYSAISADLPGLTDRISPVRSHLFIFREPADWQAFVAASPGVDAWAGSFVCGHILYLQETDRPMDTLAHEMTHLVFNRFLPGSIPLWLNEGLAEYYGEFAYRKAKGMGQSKSQAFPSFKNSIPLELLFALQSYPAEPAIVALFYKTAKYFTGFLLLKFPREQWDQFFARLLNGEPAQTALLETYGWPDLATAEKAFLKFAR